MPKQIIGGGTKKVLYTLRTVQRIGLKKAGKALRTKNACKACAYGMGGQQGGMTNEQGEFPSVCNKSVQAQSTDIQPPIPAEVFEHSLNEFRKLSAYEMEHMGRLATPVFKPADGTHYTPLSWGTALNLAAEKLQSVSPERSFFYASGRSSNEAGFVFQLLARAFGTNNVNNCSYYCHQATGVGLAATIGTGTATIEVADLDGCDLVFVIGANPASNHPRFIHKLKAVRDRAGDVIIINPAKEPGLVKFAVPKSPKSMLRGGSEIASHYMQPRIGSDIAVLKGIAKFLLELEALNADFIAEHTQGFDIFKQDIQATTWSDITALSGLQISEIKAIAQIYAKSKNTVFAWGMGVTHHLNGSDTIEYIANLALLRGMIGRKHAGLLPLRGHSNVQGIGTIGVKPVLADTVMQKLSETLNVEFPKTAGMDTMACMQAADKDEIDACILMGGNLLASNPDSKWATKSLDKIGFRVSLTTTFNQSHFVGVAGDVLILPVLARDEDTQPTTQESMFNFVRLSDGGIDRLDNVRSETSILVDLAQRILPNSPINFAAFKTHKTVRAAIAASVTNMEKLADIDDTKTEFHITNRVLHAPLFNTPNQKASFRTHPLPPAQNTAPFTLSTVRSEGQFNSIIYEEADSYRGVKTRWSVLVNAEDLADRGKVHGDLIHVRSQNGEMRNVTAYTFDLPKGNVLAYFPEANVLTDTKTDPRSKTPAFKSTPVWLEV